MAVEPTTPATATPTATATTAAASASAAPAPAAAASPDATISPVAAQPVVQAAATQAVTLTMEQLQAFTAMQTRLVQMEAEQRSRDETAQRQLQDALLAKGQAEEAVRLVRQQHDEALTAERALKAQLQQQAQGFALDVHVARAMAGHQFVNDKMRKVFEAEVRAELIAEPQGNSFNVRTATFQSADDLVRQKLAMPDYQPMLAPRGVAGTATPGQATQTGPAPAAQAPASQADKPKNLGEAIVAQYKHNQANRGADADPRRDMSRPFGLKAANLN